MTYLALAPHTIVVVLTMAAAVLAAIPPLRRSDRSGALRVASRVLLAGAVLAVLAGTLLGTTSTGRNLNLVPGASIADSLAKKDLPHGLRNVLGNVVLFAPLGFLAVLALRRRVRAVTGMGAVLSLGIEVSQFATARRWGDIDDVLLNTTGALLGAAAAAAVYAEVVRRRSSATSVAGLRTRR